MASGERVRRTGERSLRSPGARCGVVGPRRLLVSFCGFSGRRPDASAGPRTPELLLEKSHELAPAEGVHVRRVETEPLAVHALRFEALVPIRLDSGGVVGLDDVHRARFLGELNRELAFAATG